MKRFIIQLSLSLLGIILIISFNIIGSSVLPNGELAEHFFLLAIGLFLIIISFFWAFVSFIVMLIKGSKKK